MDAQAKAGLFVLSILAFAVVITIVITIMLGRRLGPFLDGHDNIKVVFLALAAWSILAACGPIGWYLLAIDLLVVAFMLLLWILAKLGLIK